MIYKFFFINLFQGFWRAILHFDPTQYISKVLNSIYNEANSRNPSFSKAAFAKKLGISSGALSEILSKKRRLSRDKAILIFKNASVSQPKIEMLNTIYNSQNQLEQLNQLKNNNDERMLTNDQFELMADWRYFAFLGFIRIYAGSGVSRNEIKRRFDIPFYEIDPPLESGNFQDS